MDAFEQLVTANTPAVYRLARAFAGDAGAEDLAQESFLAAWRALPTLREPDRFGPWLYRIVLNRCRSSVRGPGKVREIPIGQTLVEPTAPGDFPRSRSVLTTVGTCPAPAASGRPRVQLRGTVTWTGSSSRLCRSGTRQTVGGVSPRWRYSPL
jgi:DNA-directed RNA polymerase specialized sigma24 family protein